MSVRTQYSDVVIDTEGNALDTITVTVKLAGTNTNATIYSTRGGVGTIANPITTTSTGLVQFWANPGSYDITFHDGTLPARILDRTVTFEAISGAADGVSGIQLPDGTSGQILITDGSTYTPRSVSGAFSLGTTGAVSMTSYFASQPATDGVPNGGAWQIVHSAVEIHPGAGTYLVWGKAYLLGGDQLSKKVRITKDFEVLDQAEGNPMNPSSSGGLTLSCFARTTCSGGESIQVQGSAPTGAYTNYGQLMMLRVA